MNTENALDMSEVIGVKTIESRYINTRRGNVVGFCHYHLHPGSVTKKNVESHKCIEKGCPFLSRYEANPFWKSVQRSEARKAEIKKKKRLRKAMNAMNKASVAERTAEFQKIADKTGYNIRILRVERPSRKMFHVFYVSEYAYADGHKFPELIRSIQKRYGRCGILMKHVRAADGRFVTINEYIRRHRR